MRSIDTILADIVEPALAAELRDAIDLEQRRARNAQFAEARRSYERLREEHAEALAVAIADVRRERELVERELAEVRAERDRLRAELDAISTADTPEIAAGAARLKAITAGRRPGRIA